MITRSRQPDNLTTRQPDNHDNPTPRSRQPSILNQKKCRHFRKHSTISLFSGMGKLLILSTVLCISMVLLGINRGFDISDEGLYVLLADPHQQNVAGILNYDLFFKLIYQISGYSFSLPELRIIRLLTYFAGAWALSGFWKNIKNEDRIDLNVFLIFSLGLMAGYAFLPHTLSYNSLTVVLVCFWLNQVSQNKFPILKLLFLGMLLGLLIYIKISLALLFFPLTFSILVIWKKLNPIHTVVLLLPIIFFETLFGLVFEQNAISRLWEGIPVNSQRSGYQLGFMIESIAVGGFWVTITGSIFFVISFLKKIESPMFKVVLPILLLGMAAISYFTHITNEWNHLILISFAGLFGFCLGKFGWPIDSPKIWILFLLLLPFLMHFGSNVYWLRIGIHYVVFWIFGFLLLFERLKLPTYFATSFLAIGLVFNGIWWHPFGQESPLWSEKKSWFRKESESVQIDPELVIILSKLAETEVGDTSQPLLAAYRIPGLVWLSARQLPLYPGIWDRSQINSLLESKPDKMIYNSLDSLPENWSFLNRQQLGVFQGDTLRLLWD